MGETYDRDAFLDFARPAAPATTPAQKAIGSLAVFGFISIPTMAAAAFLLIIALLFLLRVLERSAMSDPATTDASE